MTIMTKREKERIIYDLRFLVLTVLDEEERVDKLGDELTDEWMDIVFDRGKVDDEVMNKARQASELATVHAAIRFIEKEIDELIKFIEGL